MDRLKEFMNEHKLKIILTLLAIIVGLMIILFIMMGQHGDSSVPNSMANEQSSSVKALKSSNQDSRPRTGRFQSTFIDVEGAVKHPGVYQFTNNMRVDDAVNLAGGLNRSADRKHINLAKKLVDQETVYIPVRGEIKGLPSSDSSSSAGSDGKSESSDTSDKSSSGGQININTADAKQLESVNGIGEKRADKIIEYRKSHGNFKQLSDLKKISGIGDKFFDNIKGHVTV